MSGSVNSTMASIASYRFLRWRSGGFRLNAFRLALGAVAGQGLTVLAAPLVTRLFSPESFGVLAVYLSLSTILAEVAALRYEGALMITEKETETLSLAYLCVLASLLSGLVLLAAAPLVSGTDLAASLGLKHSAWVLYLVPPTVFALSMQNVLRLWWIRQAKIGTASISSLLQGLFDNGTKVAAGMAGLVGSFGLILGQITGLVGALLFLSKGIRPVLRKSELRKKTGWREVWRSARRYKGFPLYNSWSSLINALSLQVPVLMLGNLFGVEAAGYYLLASRVLKIPSRFLGQAVSQSLLKEVAEQRRKARPVFPLVRRVLCALAALVSLPVGILLLGGDALFGHLFGASWAPSGGYARIMSPWIATQFLAYSVGTVFMSLERNRILSLLQLLLFLASILPFGVSLLLGQGPLETLVLLSGCNSLAFVIYTASALVVSAQHDRFIAGEKGEER